MLPPFAAGRWSQAAARGGTPGPTAPAQFGTSDWSPFDNHTSGDVIISITALPSDGGSAITDLEYQIDGGSWVSLAGTATGNYTVSGLTDDVEVDFAVRAVNAIGNGTASSTKAVTPTADIDFSFIDADLASSLLDLGAEHPNRHIIAAIGASHSTGITSVITGVTINGVTATSSVISPATSFASNASIWIAHVPSGTSGNVFTTTTPGFNRVLRGAYRIVGLQSATASDIDAADSLSGVSIVIPAGGFGIVVAGRHTLTTAYTLSNVTDDARGSAGTAHYAAMGSKTSVAGETLNSNASISGTSVRMAAASFR